jgi:thiol-disulfide isomerase/thioredoxin
MALGQVRVGVTSSFSYIDSSHHVEEDQFEKDPVTGEPKELQAAEHEVDLALLDSDVRVSFGLGARFAWELRLPFRVVAVDAGFRDATGRELEGFESIHHRDEVVAGIGDVELGGRIRAVSPQDLDATLFDVIAAVALPTGDVEENPFELGRRGLDHQHIFFGTGTVDPILGINGSHGFGPVDLALWGTARTSLYSGSIGYRSGTKLTLGVALATGFGLDDWYFSLGPEVYHEEPSTWDDGSVSSNSGRTNLGPVASAFWQPNDLVQPYLLLKKPFTLRALGGQLDLPIVVSLGVNFNFNVLDDGGDDDGHGHAHGGHDHGHDHGDEHRPPPAALMKGDVEDLAVGGASFVEAEAAVPGKVTVVDFWATWCHPCADIGVLLQGLAAEHDDLAVRRVEVVDDDSPVVGEHLGEDVMLPVIWIYDRSGQRVHDLRGTSEEVVHDAVEALLERP